MILEAFSSSISKISEIVYAEAFEKHEFSLTSNNFYTTRPKLKNKKLICRGVFDLLILGSGILIYALNF